MKRRNLSVLGSMTPPCPDRFVSAGLLRTSRILTDFTISRGAYHLAITLNFNASKFLV
jgi:hypothetical protein